MPMNSAVLVDTTPFAVELRKTAAESGWDEQKQKEVLLGFIASSGRFRGSLLSEYRQYLDAMSREEPPIAIAFPAPEKKQQPLRAAEEADEDDDFEDDDQEDDLDDEDDFEDDDEDDLDDEDDFEDEEDDEDDEDEDDTFDEPE